MAAVTEHDNAVSVGELVQRLCRFAVNEMGLPGCALVLMSGAESASVLAGAGRHARTVSGLQMELGEGPCLHAHASGMPVLLPESHSGEREPLASFRGGCPGGRRARRVLPAVDRGARRYRHVRSVPGQTGHAQ